MFIRANSDSSGPDNITITLKPDRGSEVTDNAESASFGIGSTVSVESMKNSDSEDTSSHFGTSAGSYSTEHPIRRVGSASSDTPIRRIGSASSNTSSEVSQGSLTTRKPPTLPKPRMLNVTSPSPTQNMSPTPPTTAVTPPPSAAPSKPAKPPPKPSRGMSHKAKISTPAGSTHGSVNGTQSLAENRDSSPRVSPSRTAPVPKGRVSPRPMRSSAPIAGTSVRSSAPGPPPKPARVAGVRFSQSKSESDSGHSSGRDEMSKTSTSPSPLTLNSEREAAQMTPPPPKPRRGKSVKILDPSEEKSKTLSAGRPTRQPPQHEGHTSATLPHHFRVGGQREAAMPGGGGGSGSPKPVPVPRPRTSVGTLGSAKNPEGNIRSSRKEVSAK